MDVGDRYCMDGQRLVAVSGTYGADATEFRTYSTAGSGPAWFKAWTEHVGQHVHDDHYRVGLADVACLRVRKDRLIFLQLLHGS